EAGAEFIQTQFCMDPDAVRRYAARLLELGVAQKLPILIGIAPIPSARSARWMKEKLFGAMIPDRIVDRLERAADPKAEGRRICVELLQQLAETPGVAGAHVMAPTFHSAIGPVIEASRVAGTRRAGARPGELPAAAEPAAWHSASVSSRSTGEGSTSAAAGRGT